MLHVVVMIQMLHMAEMFQMLYIAEMSQNLHMVAICSFNDMRCRACD